jgi:hypothetical protein
MMICMNFYFVIIIRLFFGFNGFAVGRERCKDIMVFGTMENCF